MNRGCKQPPYFTVSRSDKSQARINSSNLLNLLRLRRTGWQATSATREKNFRLISESDLMNDDEHFS